MKNFFIVSLFFLISFMILPFNIHETNAQLECLPEACRRPGQFEVDFECQGRKLLDPSETCCVEKCIDDQTTINVDPGFDPLFEFFGYSFAVRSGQQIPVLINLAITTFLGIVSVYALIMGIYQGAIVRAGTTDPEQIEKASKSFVTLIGGFVLAWGFIVIIQVVANLIGLGSLQDLTLIGEGGGTTITIN